MPRGEKIACLAIGTFYIRKEYIVIPFQVSQ
jgi:hypothetical protein